MIFYGISKGSSFFFACGLISGGLAKRDFSPTMGAHGTMSKGEVDVGLGISAQFIAEVRGAYRFPINDILAWDAGLGVGYYSVAFLGGRTPFANNPENSFMTEAFASFWFWDFYASYGLGIAVNKEFGPVMLIPTDFRIGWQPNFRKRDRGFLFKMELGLLPYVGSNINKLTYTSVALTLGTSYNS